ncbi:MAG: hypothetical protein WC343_04810 [Bacilli bacterium]
MLKNKWFWYAVIAIIVLIILKRNMYVIKQWLRGRDVSDTNSLEGNLDTVRKESLKGMANAMWEDMDGLNLSGHDTALWNSVYATTDTELIYLAKYYKRYVRNGVSLYEDIGDELMPGTDIDEKIRTRLSKVGETI